MEIPDNNQPVQSTKADWHQLLIPPYIFSAFEKATSELAWDKIERASNWQKILPCPPLNPSEIDSFNFSQFHQISYPRQPKKSLSDFTVEREKEWAGKAEKWFLESKLIILNKKEQVRIHCQDCLKEWKSEKKNLTSFNVEILVEKWSLHYGNNNISWLKYFLVTEKKVGSFILETIKKRKADFGLAQESLSSNNVDAKNIDINFLASPLEKQPTLFIPSEMQTRLFKTLSANAPTDQHMALGELLENGISESRIWVKLRADSLAYIFKQARDARTSSIEVGMKELARWLAAYFSWGENAPKAISLNYAYKVLRGNETVEKDNQIRLKQ